MIRIASTLSILKQHLDEAFARAKAENVSGRPWQLVIPIATLPDRVKFTPEELTFMMLLDKDLFNDMGPFDDVHNTLLEAFQVYASKRTELTDMFPAEMKSGGLGTSTFTRDEMMRIAPRAAALDVLIEGMMKRCDQDSAEGWVLLQKLAAALNKEFNLKLVIEVKDWAKNVEPVSNSD